MPQQQLFQYQSVLYGLILLVFADALLSQETAMYFLIA